MSLDPRTIYVAQRTDDGSAWREVYLSGSNLVIQTNSDGYLTGSSILPSGIIIVSSSYSHTSSVSISASYSNTASFSRSTISASYAISSSKSATASFADYSVSSSFSQSSSYALSSSKAFLANFASVAITAISSSYSNTSTSASYVISASYANNVVSASYSITSSFSNKSLTASYLIGGAGTIDTGSFVVTASGALTNLTASYTIISATASYVDFSSVANKPTLISGSAQVLIGSGVYSASAQLPDGLISGSDQVTMSYAYTASYALNSTSLPTGVVSSSTQIDFNSIQNQPTTIATASYVATSSWALNSVTASYALNSTALPDGVVSSSAQILSGSGIYSSSIQLPAGLISGSSQVFDGSGVYSGSAQLPSGIVSSSIQTIAGLQTTGIYSSSAQLPVGLYSGSSQLPSGIVSSSAQTITGLVGSSIVSASAQVISNLIGSNIVSSSLQFDSSDTIIVGQLSASSIQVDTLHVLTVTSSVVYASGSNIIGSDLSNTQQLTGSVEITGSLTVSGIIYTGNNTISGTASFSTTASYVTTAQTASYVATASWANNFNSGSFAVTGSNIFIGDQIVSGSLYTTGSNTLIGDTQLTGSFGVSGSTLQVGNNTMLGNTTLSGSIIISGSYGTSTPSVKIYGDTQVDGYLKLDPVTLNINNNLTASYIYVSGSTNDLYFTQNAKGTVNTTRLRWLEENLYTGLLWGGIITQLSPTTYQVSSGSGLITKINASLTADPIPTVHQLTWGNLTGNINQYSASVDQQYISVDSSGSIYAQGTPWIDGDYDVRIPIGLVVHNNRSTINAVKTQPSVGYGFKQRQYVFTKAFGPLKLTGYAMSPSGSSTRGLKIGAGTAFSEGSNYIIDPENPSYVSDSGTNTSYIWRYRQSGSSWVYDTNSGVGYTAIDPTKYSLNGVLAGVSGNHWTIQRVFWFPNSATKAIVVYYGNAEYPNLTAALANIGAETFVESANTATNAIYVGALLLRDDASFLTAASYQIVQGGLFRNNASAGGGYTVSTTLATLSDVSIVSPTENQPLVYKGGVWVNDGLTGSLVGTSSWSENAVTASYVIGVSGTSFSQGGNSFSTTASIGTNDAYPIFLKTNNTERMRIDSVGNIGINKTTPTATFDVSGSVKITGSLSVSSSIITSGVTSSAAIFLSRAGTVATQIDGYVSANGTTALVGVPVQISPRMRFQSSGWDVGTSVAKTFNWSLDNWPVSAATASSYLKIATDPGTGTFAQVGVITDSGCLIMSPTITTPSTAFAKFHAEGSGLRVSNYIRNATAGGYTEIVFDNDTAYGEGQGCFVLGYGGTATANSNQAYFFNRQLGDIMFGTNNTERMRLLGNGNLSIGLPAPVSASAYLHIKAGTTAAGTSPIKLTSGSLLTVPESGSLEFDGTNYWVSPTTTRYMLLTNGMSVISSSAQLPSGIISGSSQVTMSYAYTASYIATSSWAYNSITASYVNFSSIGSKPALVSGSFQLENGGGATFTTSSNVTIGQITASIISASYITASNIFVDTLTVLASSMSIDNLTVNDLIRGTSSYALTASYINYNRIDIQVSNVSSSVVLTNLSKTVQNVINITSSININLPLIASDMSFTLKKSDASSYFANVISTPGQLIDGYQTQSLTSFGDSLSLIANPTFNNWIII